MANFLLPLALSATGLFLLIRLRFFFILHPIKTANQIVKGLSDRESRRSLLLALAGTLGVGNIFGVAAGIMIGGAGAVFWIFFSSVFSAIIKYSETLLAYDSRGKAAMAETVQGIFGCHAERIYAVLTLALALLMGARMQASAVLDVAVAGLKLNPIFIGIILLILLLPCLLSGKDNTPKITEILIPLTTIIYIIMCFCVIFANFSKLGHTINLIFASAFTPSSFLGGILPIALREGFSRGILSNEAGIGSSATAHVRAGERTPHEAGLFGMLEVFFDTTLLCTLSGIVILTSVENISYYSTPMSLVTGAFVSSLGEWSGYILTFLILSFAYATIICWYYYGLVYSEAYFRKIPFKPLFVLFLFLPIGTAFLLSVVDLVIFLMTMIVLPAIIKRTGRICDLSRMDLNKPDS